MLLDARKVVFWEEKSLLIVSDVHLGKAGHFRKNGVPIPKRIHYSDLDCLSDLISDFSPKGLIFLGDLFHSEFNKEWDIFCLWLEQYPHVNMKLVRGNHDVLPSSLYDTNALTLIEELIEPPFHFTHEAVQSDYYNISGHVHPSIKLRGSARQSISASCFYFANEAALLPAFGKFTGNCTIRPKRGSNVFAIASSQIIALVG